jgi:hypothetical protein
VQHLKQAKKYWNYKMHWINTINTKHLSLRTSVTSKRPSKKPASCLSLLPTVINGTA